MSGSPVGRTVVHEKEISGVGIECSRPAVLEVTGFFQVAYCGIDTGLKVYLSEFATFGYAIEGAFAVESECARVIAEYEIRIRCQVGLLAGLQVDAVEVEHQRAVVAERIAGARGRVYGEISRSVRGQIYLVAQRLPCLYVIGLYPMAVGVGVSLPIIFLSAVVTRIIPVAMKRAAIVG